jgi:hypothetical protein
LAAAARFGPKAPLTGWDDIPALNRTETREPSPVEPVLRGLPGDVLHDDARQRPGVLDGVDGDHEVVGEGRRRATLSN